MAPSDKRPIVEQAPDLEVQASEAFLRRRSGKWNAEDQADYESRLAEDPLFLDAAERVERAWQATGEHGAAPELMAYREQALARARRASARRWLNPDGRWQRRWRMAAAIAGVALVLGIAVQLSPYGYRPGTYRTGIGEQRVAELADHSRIALDAKTELRVRYSVDARVVELAEGQAQFTVARDPQRPFRVEAGGASIVAIGTSFTVEYVDREMQVALLEGRVAVNVGDAGQPTELSAGEAMRIGADGQATVIPNADLEAATAWRQGKVIFRGEPLGEAVQRLNRYSRLQLAIDDPRLAGIVVSGVFEAGDTPAFAEAVQSYLPVTADYSEPGVVRLQHK
jgi:transmembrane sensor